MWRLVADFMNDLGNVLEITILNTYYPVHLPPMGQSYSHKIWTGLCREYLYLICMVPMSHLNFTCILLFVQEC
jgi:hypothetical protein